MSKKFITLFILLAGITLPTSAEFAFSEGIDFTGESFFESTAGRYTSEKDGEKKHTSNPTIPPAKLLRLNLKNKKAERAAKNNEYAPTAETPSIYTSDSGTSEYASKEIKDDFEDMSPDGFDADEESIAENGKKKTSLNKKNKQTASEDTEDIILDCDNVDYDTPNYLVKATGNVSVEFVKQKTIVKADILTFDRVNNTIKAEGNVRILKNERVVTGDYIFVDLNEENALIENPLSRSASVEIRSKKGYVYGDKIIQEQGQIEITDSYPIEFRSGRRGPRMNRMLTPENETLTEDMEKGLIKVRADVIKIKQKGDLEVLTLKKAKVARGKHTIIKIPAVKVYTNKNHDYAETNLWEIGYYRGLGFYTGPGFVFELPKGSVLKAVPFLNYNDGAGIGALGRFSSGTNQTTAAYGSVSKKFYVSGRQNLDDKLYLDYAMNSYMDEWFLGRRRPKYGVSLVYKDSYSSENFLIPGKTSSFSHRIEAGYFHDLDFDSHFNKVKSGGTMGTTRFRYMAQYRQTLFSYKNPDKLFTFSFNLLSNLSAAVYGTGDTQVVGNLIPLASVQYKRWMQDIGYSFNAFEDKSPFLRYDRYRYGSQYLYLREYFRINKWLTVSWFANINTTNDAYNRRKVQENTFYLSVGPEDFKLHLGYDFERSIFRAAFEVMMDAKGTNIEYNTFELKQDKKARKDNKPAERKVNNNLAPTNPKVLQRAVVEKVQVTDDVL